MSHFIVYYNFKHAYVNKILYMCPQCQQIKSGCSLFLKLRIAMGCQDILCNLQYILLSYHKNQLNHIFISIGVGESLDLSWYSITRKIINL